MKRIIITFVSICCLLVISCKKERNQRVSVVKDCTGTYLQLDGKDYHVCNIEKTDAFQDGTLVTASFKKISDCTGKASTQIVCMMSHPSEGWIEVLSIKE
jgi:hypothetical protein